MKLGKLQELQFHMIARKGTGRMHAKWSPVATCIMFKEPIIKLDDNLINKKMSPEDRKTFVKKCPRNVYKFNELKQAVEIENSHACNLCIECYRFADEKSMGEAVKLYEND
jgi:DNA-directed RNA polymerase alpha subunit